MGESAHGVPNYNVMYTVLAVVKDGKVMLSVRSRQGYSRGYAYLDVKVQCRRSK